MSIEKAIQYFSHSSEKALLYTSSPQLSSSLWTPVEVSAVITHSSHFLSESIWPHNSRHLHKVTLYPLFFRNGEPRGVGTGGAGLQDAVSSGLPGVAARNDAALLEEGARRAAHFRIYPVLPRGLFHRHWATVPARRQPVKTRALQAPDTCHHVLISHRDAS